jgi:hypothetical protein
MGMYQTNIEDDLKQLTILRDGNEKSGIMVIF